MEPFVRNLVDSKQFSVSARLILTVACVQRAPGKLIWPYQAMDSPKWETLSLAGLSVWEREDAQKKLFLLHRMVEPSQVPLQTGMWLTKTRTLVFWFVECKPSGRIMFVSPSQLMMPEHPCCWLRRPTIRVMIVPVFLMARSRDQIQS